MNPEIQTDTFIISYTVSSTIFKKKDILCHLNFEINTQSKDVYGKGTIEYLKTGVHLETQIYGKYVEFDTSEIVVITEGYSASLWPPMKLAEEKKLSNLTLRIVLSADWKKGNALLKYKANDGNWLYIKDAKVKVLSEVENALSDSSL